MPTFREDPKIGTKVPLIKTADLNDKSVTEKKLADGSITNDKIATGAVTSEKLKHNAVTTETISDGAVTAEKIAEGAVSVDEIKDLSVEESKINNKAVTNVKIDDAAVDTRTIEDKSVTNAKIADESITQEKIFNSSVTTEKLANESVSAEKLQSGLRSTIVSTHDKAIELDKKKANVTDVDYALERLENKIGDRVVVEGNVTNLPDDEDLTSVQIGGREVVKLNDRAYEPSNFSGKGYKILRKNIQRLSLPTATILVSNIPSSSGDITITINGKTTTVSLDVAMDTTTAIIATKIGTALKTSLEDYDVSVSSNTIVLTRNNSKYASPSSIDVGNTTAGISVKDSITKSERRNVLMQDMINDPNTVYEIRYDFDLDGEEIKFKPGCAIKFNNGTISNGTIVLQNTKICHNNGFFNYDVVLKGTYQGTFHSSFWNIGEIGEDAGVKLKQIFNNIKIPNITFVLDDDIVINSGNIVLPSYIKFDGGNHIISFETNSTYGSEYFLFAINRESVFCNCNIHIQQDYKGTALYLDSRISALEKIRIYNIKIKSVYVENHMYNYTGIRFYIDNSIQYQNYITGVVLYNISIIWSRIGIIMSAKTIEEIKERCWNNDVTFRDIYISAREIGYMQEFHGSSGYINCINILNYEWQAVNTTAYALYMLKDNNNSINQLNVNGLIFNDANYVGVCVNSNLIINKLSSGISFNNVTQTDSLGEYVVYMGIKSYNSDISSDSTSLSLFSDKYDSYEGVDRYVKTFKNSILSESFWGRNKVRGYFEEYPRNNIFFTKRYISPYITEENTLYQLYNINSREEFFSQKIYRKDQCRILNTYGRYKGSNDFMSTRGTYNTQLCRKIIYPNVENSYILIQGTPLFIQGADDVVYGNLEKKVTCNISELYFTNATLVKLISESVTDLSFIIRVSNKAPVYIFFVLNYPIEVYPEGEDDNGIPVYPYICCSEFKYTSQVIACEVADINNTPNDTNLDGIIIKDTGKDAFFIKSNSSNIQITTPKKDTTSRPSLVASDEGFRCYDRTLKKEILWNGTEWTNMDGTALG
jgi:hypothetical protein